MKLINLILLLICLSLSGCSIPSDAGHGVSDGLKKGAQVTQTLSDMGVPYAGSAWAVITLMGWAWSAVAGHKDRKEKEKWMVRYDPNKPPGPELPT